MAFNKNFYLDMEDDIDELDTERPVLPAGEYLGVIGDYNPERWFSGFEGTPDDNGNEREDAYYVSIPFIIQITSPELHAELGQDRFFVNYRLRLDIKNGRIDTGKGKNHRLGALRKLLDQNYSGWSWRELAGKGPLNLTVTIFENKNTGDRSNQVSKVALPSDEEDDD